MRGVVRGWAWACVIVLCGCHFSRSEHPDACKQDSDCDEKKGETCESGYCVTLGKSGGKDDDAGNGNSGGGGSGGKGGSGGTTGNDAGGVNDSGAGGGDNDAGNDAGHMTNTGCDPSMPPVDCYDGPKHTKDVGECRGGQRACIDGKFTPCLGQVLPSMEMCNGKDDNCDGTEDEFAMQADCDTSMKGVCKAGALVCRGNYAVCEPVSNPSDEVCNGKDDDCDGTKDNDITAAQCYPPNTPGCVLDNGVLKCTGTCQAGHSACTNGNDGCPDAVTPVAEHCTTGSELAADENCDGTIDEGCNCTNNATRDCYSGPVGTEMHLPCHTGTQTCSTANNVNGEWGPCMGEVDPQRETCDNIGSDDDCDTMVDNYPDIPGLGTACLDDTQQGICHGGTWQCQTSTEPVCVGMSAQHEQCDPEGLDQDCDGDPSNGYDLSTDVNNCGKCGNACGVGDDCCNGQCSNAKDYRFDRLNCGKCGNQCGSGNYCCWNDCMLGGKGVIVEPGPDSVCGCKQDCGDKWCCFDGCVDIKNDEKNCGQCGKVCASGYVCCGGSCQSSTLLCNIRL